MAVLLGAALQPPEYFDSLKYSASAKSIAEPPARRPEELFDAQLGLVKTVRNTDWLALIRKLRIAESNVFRTSVSLPPPGAVNMRLFGEPRTNCAGLVWDLSQVDLSEAYIWPSGYMAKTEFNLNHKGELVNGRSSALVTIDRLVECNRLCLTMNAETGEMQEVGDGATMNFNEINWPCKGTHGIVAVFVRSMELGHVLHALGIVTLLKHALGLQLPLLRLDSRNPVCLLDNAVLDAYLRQALPPALERWPVVLVPRLPVDLTQMHFSDMEKLKIHAMYGLTRSSLRQLFEKYTDDPVRFHELLSAGLKACVALRNVPSARELVRTTSPFLLGFRVEETACHESRLLTEVLVLSETLPEGSEDLQVVLGAEVMLVEFRSGETKRRIDNAVEELGEWLRKVTSQCSVCDFFSWVETWKKERASRVSSFISGKAVVNRTDFLKHLKRLRDAQDSESYVRELYEVVQALRSPCLRFHMLRDVLGLDRRFSRNVLHAIVCFAFDIFVPRASSAFEVDESTRLEAEESACLMKRRSSREILGVETPEDFSADPLGVETRLFRALYQENRSRKFS